LTPRAAFTNVKDFGSAKSGMSINGGEALENRCLN